MRAAELSVEHDALCGARTCAAGLHRSGQQLRVEVRDTGPGIAPNEQQLIFQEFRRGSAAGGQGLGWVCRSRSAWPAC
ncbi:ATP-binding protein [Rhodanobacter terrae]|uniref:ATP-binding protein n=1 Tax=Rhodanobacter terrae TaxID=418647 RepID=A0ABW0SZT7_9GAMM